MLVGFDNYARAFEDGRFWHSTLQTGDLHRRHRAGCAARRPGPGAARQSAVQDQVAGAPWSLLLPWALPLVFAGLDLSLVLRVPDGHRQRTGSMRVGIEPPNWLSDPTLATGRDLHRHRLEGIVVHGADAACRAADDTQIAVRGGRGRRRVEVAAILRDHAAHAASGDFRRADLPHDHRRYRPSTFRSP